MFKIIRFFQQQLQRYFSLQNTAKNLAQAFQRTPDNFEGLYSAVSTTSEFLPSQMRTEIKFLYDLIRKTNSMTICEIGTFFGGTLIMFCNAASSDAKILSVDIKSTFNRRQALGRFRRAGQKLKIIVGDSHSVGIENRIKAEFNDTGLDFLFIDGDHSLFGVINDFVRYSPLVKPGGIVAFHDINPDSFIKTGIKTHSYVGGVPYFWEMIKKSGYKTEEFIEDPNQDGFGIGIIYKE